MADARTGKGKAGVPPPKCKALLLCERAIIDANGGNVSLISIFDKCTLPEPHGTVSPFTVYTQLTDGIEGHQYEFTVELHDLSKDVVIARTPDLILTWKDRLTRISLVMLVRSLQITDPGVYDAVVLANREEVDRQQFRVVMPPGRNTRD